MKILITAFEPFGGHEINSSFEVMSKYAETQIKFNALYTAKIKLEFETIRFQIRELLEQIKPDIILLLGQAIRPAISIEKVAINYVDSHGVSYNDGKKVSPQKIIENGPNAYFSTLPINKIVTELRNASIPAYISLSAGSYGCNQIFYETMYYLDRKERLDKTIAGFIHIPLLPKQALKGDKPTVDLELLVKGLSIILDTSVDYFNSI